jgi:hypothetical protein
MRALSVLLSILFVPALITAQQMPDPSQMAGRPLPAPELPAGTVTVRVVRERMGNNVPNHPVTLKAAGKSLNATTDAQGRAQFANIPPGTRITVETVVDGESLQSQEFPVPADGGVRVALIAGIEAAAARERAAAEAGAQQPARQGVVTFAGETRIILEFQDDNLQVFYLLDIVNSARTPIDVGEPLVIELPDGATGAGAMEGSSPLAQVQGERIRINGPFPPGTTAVQVGYRLPFSGDRTTLVQRWPAAIEQLFVAAEKVGGLQIASPQFTRQQEAQASGAPFLMATGGRVNAGETLTVELTGLPHHSTVMRDAGLAIGFALLAIGLWAGVTGGPARVSTAQLAQRKDKLFADLVEVEAQHRSGRIDQRRYASKRQTLMTQLEQVMSELDRTPGGGVAA